MFDFAACLLRSKEAWSITIKVIEEWSINHYDNRSSFFVKKKKTVWLDLILPPSAWIMLGSLKLCVGGEGVATCWEKINFVGLWILEKKPFFIKKKMDWNVNQVKNLTRISKLRSSKTPNWTPGKTGFIVVKYFVKDFV